MDFNDLRKANLARNEVGEVFRDELENWSLADWCLAVAGECGEVCNAVKKLRRISDGAQTSKDPQNEGEAVVAIAKEMADVICYLDLLAAKLGIDLSLAVMIKFNEVSERMGSKVYLRP